jgi:hypothetical protein
MRLHALERTKDAPSPRLADILFRGWIGAIRHPARWFTAGGRPTPKPA